MKRFCANGAICSRDPRCGSTSQPRRQPVIPKYFEKLCSTYGASVRIPARCDIARLVVHQPLVDLIHHQKTAIGNTGENRLCRFAFSEMSLPVGLLGDASNAPFVTLGPSTVRVPAQVWLETERSAESGIARVWASVKRYEHLVTRVARDRLPALRRQ